MRYSPPNVHDYIYHRGGKYIQGIRSGRQSAWRTMSKGSWHCTRSSDQNHPLPPKKRNARI